MATIPLCRWLAIVLCAGTIGRATAEIRACATPPQIVPGIKGTLDRGECQSADYVISERSVGKRTAYNHAQRWALEFDGRGFLVDPKSGDWKWGLELGSVGQAPLSLKPTVSLDGHRLSYRWSDAVEEWFLNDARGLEQGWTIHEKIPGDRAKLSDGFSLTLRIRGGLQPRISPNGRNVVFQRDDGSSALSYGGLKAWDAVGKEVQVRFTAAGQEEELAIHVEDVGATYPIMIDPIAQQAYIKASNTGADDAFGTSVSMSGNTLVVGAVGEDSSATGIGGDQANNDASLAGAVYIFEQAGIAWAQQAYLKASNTEAGDVFGSSVAISGNTLVVGASGEASGATGFNGNQGDNGLAGSGAAYVFVKNGSGIWSQQAYLKASNPDANDSFGSVAISGDTLVIGAQLEDSSATGIGGDQDDDTATDSGAAYVFRRNGAGTWSQQAYLKASNTGLGDRFGSSVAISGDTIVVGARRESSASTGVNGDQDDNSANQSGAAYVFVRDGAGNWSQQAYLKASNTTASDLIGEVAISGNTLVIGGDGRFGTQGGIYIFSRDSGGIWTQQATFDSSATSVAISGNNVVIGETAFNLNNYEGEAFVTTRDNTGAWGALSQLQGPYIPPRDFYSLRFGNSVAISGRTVAVGATREESAATGINGDQTNGSAVRSGAAYVFDTGPLAGLDFAITDIAFNGVASRVDFIGEAGVTGWKVKGSADLNGFPNDHTPGATIIELLPGSYQATIDLSGVVADRYFLRIERQ